MSLAKEIKDLCVERKTILDAAGKIRAKAASEKRAMNAEEETEFEKRHAEGDALLKRIEQSERQLAAESSLKEVAPDKRMASRPDFSEQRTTEEDEAARKNRAAVEDLQFRAYLRGGVNALPAEQRADFQKRIDLLDPEEQRALSVTTGPSVAATGTAGATLAPQGFEYDLETAMKYYGGIIDVADYIDTATGAPLPWPAMSDTSNEGEETAENNTVDSAADPSFSAVTFGAWMVDSHIVLVPIQLLDDSAFPVDKFLTDALGTRLGRRLNKQATVGTGSSTLTGVVTAATAGKTFTNAASYTYNDILDLEYSVDKAYRNYKNPKVGYMVSDAGHKTVRKLTDSSNRPLWIAGGVSEGIVNRAPDTLNGWPCTINAHMADPAASAKSMLFGDFSKFKIRRVKEVRVLRLVERYADKFQVGFVAFQRFDSNLVDAGMHPIKYGVHPAS